MHCPASRSQCFVGLGALLAPCVTLVADDRPATVSAAGGNPLALNAAAFLVYTRDYWGTFTELLPRRLDHGPTLGGAAERRKFSDWYSKTLQSYWRVFGEHPPIDVWPPALERFGRDVCWLRVNGGDYWLIPRPGQLWQQFRRLLYRPSGEKT